MKSTSGIGLLCGPSNLPGFIYPALSTAATCSTKTTRDNPSYTAFLYVFCQTKGQSMTVLVTGGAGYIGSHTVHALVDAGERVVVLDNLSTGFATALPKQMLPIVGDVGDQALVASLIEDHGVEAIIHFAGSTIVPESM